MDLEILLPNQVSQAILASFSKFFDLVTGSAVLVCHKLLWPSWKSPTTLSSITGIAKKGRGEEKEILFTTSTLLHSVAPLLQQAGDYRAVHYHSN
jgi:hypothetical protein